MKRTFPITASDLSQRITLLKPTLTLNALGDTLTNYTQEAEIWAHFRVKSAKEKAIFQARHAVIDAVVTFRFRDDVAENWRIVYQSEMYEIIGCEDIDQKGAYLRCEMQKITA